MTTVTALANSFGILFAVNDAVRYYFDPDNRPDLWADGTVMELDELNRTVRIKMDIGETWRSVNQLRNLTSGEK